MRSIAATIQSWSCLPTAPNVSSCKSFRSGTMFAVFTAMKNVKHLEQLLANMGHNADAVAATLKVNGVMGVRNTVRYLNPVVRHVQAQLRLDDFTLDVMQRDGRQVHTLRLSLPNGITHEVELPGPVREFLEAFNAGAHAELEMSQDSF